MQAPELNPPSLLWSVSPPVRRSTVAQGVGIRLRSSFVPLFPRNTPWGRGGTWHELQRMAAPGRALGLHGFYRTDGLALLSPLRCYTGNRVPSRRQRVPGPWEVMSIAEAFSPAVGPPNSRIASLFRASCPRRGGFHDWRLRFQVGEIWSEVATTAMQTIFNWSLREHKVFVSADGINP